MAFRAWGSGVEDLQQLSAHQLKWGKSIEKLNQRFMGFSKDGVRAASALSRIGKALQGLGGGKGTKALAGFQKKMKTFIGAASVLTSFGLDILGVFLQFADALGILKPLLDVVNTVFQVIGASAMQTFMPALMNLYDVLFSPASMELWKKLGVEIGSFLTFVIDGIRGLFNNPAILTMIHTFVKAFMWVFKFIAATIGGFLSMIASWDPGMVAFLFITIATGIAFLIGLMIGGPFGPILGGIMAAATAVTLIAAFAMASMGDGGIVTKPTIALIGERGPEAVIPLSRGGDYGVGNNNDMLYATQDNGEKLDRIYYAVSSKGRLL